MRISFIRSNILKRAVLFFSILFIILCTGCSFEKKNAAVDDSLNRILDSGKLVVGIDPNFPPMGYKDENGKYVGFDLDLAKEVCKRLEIEMVVQSIDWSRKESYLNSGKIDCIWNGMSVTPERAESMCLSDPYLKNELVFLVSGKSGIRAMNDLDGKKVGVQSGSTTLDFFESSPLCSDMKEVIAPDNLSLIKKLENGRVDAVLVDSIVAYSYITHNNGNYVILPRILAEEDVAIGFRKEDRALRNKVQEILGEMKVDGTLSVISGRWFGFDITTVR